MRTQTDLANGHQIAVLIFSLSHTHTHTCAQTNTHTHTQKGANEETNVFNCIAFIFHQPAGFQISKNVQHYWKNVPICIVFYCSYRNLNFANYSVRRARLCCNKEPRSSCRRLAIQSNRVRPRKKNRLARKVEIKAHCVVTRVSNFPLSPMKSLSQIHRQWDLIYGGGGDGRQTSS